MYGANLMRVLSIYCWHTHYNKYKKINDLIYHSCMLSNAKNIFTQLHIYKLDDQCNIWFKCGIRHKIFMVKCYVTIKYFDGPSMTCVS